MSDNKDQFFSKRKRDPDQDNLFAVKDTQNKPLCMYGNKCYRKNPQHFAEYAHPDGKELISGAVQNLPNTINFKTANKQLIHGAAQQISTAQRLQSMPSTSSGSNTHPQREYHKLQVTERKTQCSTESQSLPQFPRRDYQMLPVFSIPSSSSKTIHNSAEEKLNLNISKQDSNSERRSAVNMKRKIECVLSNLSEPLQGFAARLQASSPYNFFLTKVKSSKPTHRDPRSIAFHDLLDKSLGKLESSLQMNFMVDIEWLIAQYEWHSLHKKPLTVWYDNGLEDGGRLADNIVAYKVPTPSAFGHHHTKMSMFYYEDNSLRIVVSTANLIESDWENRTQGVWVSPACPKLPLGSDLKQGESLSGFKQSLVYYLLGYNLSFSKHDSKTNFKLWYDRVLSADFSKINVCLVTSVPKTHSGHDYVKRFGHRRIADLLKTHASVPQSSWPVIAQASSIGSLGADSSAWLTSQLVASFSQTKQSTLLQVAPCKFIYPSFQNVVDSYDGLLGGACLPYRRETHTKQPWLTSFMYQWKSESRDRTRAIPHIKTYVRLSPDGQRAAWFLMTSANLSKAAWGSMNKNGSGLYVMSYEAGVLFLPSLVLLNGATEFSLQGTQPLLLPYDLPLTSYSANDTPWFSDLLNDD